MFITLGIPGNFSCFCCRLQNFFKNVFFFGCHLLIFFKNNFFKNVFQEHHQNVKRFGSKSGPTFCRSLSGSKLFAKVDSRQKQSPLTRKTHLCRMYFPILINWTSPFPISWLLGGIFHFYSNFKICFCKQTVENLIRRCSLLRLKWVCTVCLCPTKPTLGLYGLIF